MAEKSELVIGKIEQLTQAQIDQQNDVLRRFISRANKAAQHEPPPKQGKVDVADLVMVDIQARVEAGLQKYGTKLQTHNGRDALMDAYQEAIDLVMYLRQAMAERDEVKIGQYEANLGQSLNLLSIDQALWSQATFGRDFERGPIGALKHLEKEAKEAQESPTDRHEYADCFLLILDAARRAGISVFDLIEASKEKMVINRKRTWQKTDDDQPIEHIRG